MVDKQSHVSCLFADTIDVVKDQLYGGDYVKEEDPTVYLSQKTKRGPLVESWLEDYWNECKVHCFSTLGIHCLESVTRSKLIRQLLLN